MAYSRRDSIKRRDPGEAVQRVAKDEIGVDVRIQKLLGPTEFLHDGRTGRHTVSIYFLVTPESTIFRSNEQSDKIQIFSSIPQNTIPVQKRFLTEHLKLK